MGLTDDLSRLATALEGLDLPGSGPLGDDVAPVRDRLVSVIRSYLIPRLDNPDEPFLVVVAGPTGSGKSTLVNTLAGLDISRTGPVRPTTTVPLVLTRAGRHESGMMVGGVGCHVRMGAAPILDHMSLVDTPDIDSTSVDHRAVAEQLIDHADMVVFVTSALRYADDVPWEVLRRALSRGTAVIPVLNRVGAESGAAMTGFQALLTAAGIDEKPVRVPEHHLGPDAQQIPSLAVRDLRRRLFAVAREREGFHREVVNRVINVTASQIGDLVKSVRDIANRAEEIADRIRRAFASVDPLAEVDRSWAEFDISRPLDKWLPTRQPGTAVLAIWLERVRRGLIAELETALREAVASHGGEVLAAASVTPSSMTNEASPLLATAVDRWLESMGEMTSHQRYPRSALVALVSRALAPMDQPPAPGAPGIDSELVDRAHHMLETRIGVAFDHQAERLIETLRSIVGEQDTDEVERRSRAVLAAYQFADA